MEEKQSPNDPHRNLLHVLLKDSDNVSAVQSTFSNENSNLYFKRDATEAKPLAERTPPDKDANLIKNNILLKALGTFRGVKHVLEKLDNKINIDDIFKNFKSSIEQLSKQTPTLNHSQFKKQADALHEAFNINLLASLRQAGVIAGTESFKELETLLSYCRYLSGLLDPSPIVITTTKIDEKTNYVETCYPITTKTAVQKRALESAIPMDQNAKGTNFYASMSASLKKVTWAFRNELLKDDRVMSPQLRKFIPHGLKQAFVVKREITDSKNNSKAKAEALWSVRTGTLAYVGRGETNQAMQLAVNQNLTQLKEQAAKIKKNNENAPSADIHFTILNTNLPIGHENRMVAMTETAVRASDDQFSYTPANLPGRTGWARFDSAVSANAGGWFRVKRYLSSALLSPEARARRSVAAGLAVESERLNVRACASGIDRTGTGELLTSVSWLRKHVRLSEAELATKLTESGHSQVMTHILCPSSPGMKSASKLGTLFGKANNRHLYLKSANTNKQTPLAKYKKKQAFKKWRTVIIAALVGSSLALIGTGVLWWAAWMAMTSSALLLGPVGIAVALLTGIAVYLFKQQAQDWLAGISRALFGLGVVAAGIAIVGEFAGLGGASALFSSAWLWGATIAAAAPFVMPVLVMCLMVATVGVIVYAIGKKFSDKGVEKEIINDVNNASTTSSSIAGMTISNITRVLSNSSDSKSESSSSNKQSPSSSPPSSPTHSSNNIRFSSSEKQDFPETPPENEQQSKNISKCDP